MTQTGTKVKLGILAAALVALAAGSAPAQAVQTSGAPLSGATYEALAGDELGLFLTEVGEGSEFDTHPTCNANCILSQCSASCSVGQTANCKCGQVNGPAYGGTQYGVGQANCWCS